ncbi:uncharacterized protein LOC112502090 [Cynara cardunculus var. scolymus]|uniref:uncharacterized protein LOC112502090 n=1 Tax=Cynara cardunculus var. scolymus TaxID=59895 RepID=UPI000D62E122|nr:uncharacterized protein LOC112502090 [Cynara cardunculus var. scolymus]
MTLYLEGVDSQYLSILKDGPIVPKVWLRHGKSKDDGNSSNDSNDDEEKSDSTRRFIIKDPYQYNEDDKRKVSLDTKVRAIIALSLPDDVFHSLVNLSTAKDKWNTLCVLYEGTIEVKKSKKIGLVRQYELFVHGKGESLTE